MSQLGLTPAKRLFNTLNMRSATPDPSDPSVTDDRSTQARIRDAAIAQFAEHGVTGASIRAIAKDAGVSPALVIHHFGSKDALRTACDAHVAALIRSQKREAMAQGPNLDPLAALRSQKRSVPLLRYLARTLIDGTPQVAELVDRLVEDAQGYMQDGVEAGILKPSRFPRERAALLTLWSLGAVVLYEHVERLLGIDLLDAWYESPEAKNYAGPALEMFSHGLMTEAAAERMQRAFAGSSAPAEAEKETPS